MSFRNDDDFDSESYVKVNVRLMEFWTKHPEGRVETEAVLSGDRLMMVARLYRKGEEHPYATGHSFLDNLDGEKVGEYTETVALGRALANAGFKIEKSIASAQEMTRFKERQDSKKEEPKESKIKASKPQEQAAPAAEPKKELSDTPEVPKKLTTSRIFKPLPKQEQTGGK